MMAFHEVNHSSENCGSVTCQAPINIAVVKYWGKRDDKYNLPLHSSMSVTLGLKELASKTSCHFCSKITEDTFWLNGKKIDNIGSRMKKCLDEARRQCCKRKIDEPEPSSQQRGRLKIISENNFPTAAGLASSASGFAALAYGIGKLYNIQSDLSVIARLGSGSACRSMLGGFVSWEMGTCPYGSDSIAKQIASEQHWTDLHVLILVVEDHRKEVGSTDGMKLSTKTSDLLEYRAKCIVPERMKRMKTAVLNKDFPTFAEITMKESNQLHAICMDTYPPVEPPYLSMISHDIIQLVTEVNRSQKKIKAAYTFDAGPNAFIFTLTEYLEEVVSTVASAFQLQNPDNNVRDEEHLIKGIHLTLNSAAVITEAAQKIAKRRESREAKDGIKYIIHTKPGPGPKSIEETEVCECQQRL